MTLSIPKEFYGDNVRWFIGIVEDIRDPLNLGRVRVRVYGIHDAELENVNITDLPWASVVVPITDPGVGELSNPYGIRPGAQVFGMFMDGKISQMPLVLGSIPNRQNLTVENKSEDTVFVPLDNPDHRLQKGAREAKIAKKPIPILKGGNEEKAFNFLKSFFESCGSRYAAQNAAGFVGNLLHESGAGLPPSSQERGPISGRGGYGIAQWTGPRRVFFENNFCTSIEPPTAVDDFETQLQYIVYELENTHKNVLIGLKKSSTVAKSTEVIFKYYETPAVAVDYIRQIDDKPPKYQKELSSSEVVARYNDELNERTKDARHVFDTYMTGSQA